ncbi:hypothetical protein Tco_0331323 [Tanacetum coccineum]
MTVTHKTVDENDEKGGWNLSCRRKYARTEPPTGESAGSHSRLSFDRTHEFAQEIDLPTSTKNMTETIEVAKMVTPTVRQGEEKKKGRNPPPFTQGNQTGEGRGKGKEEGQMGRQEEEEMKGRNGRGMDNLL